MKNIAHQLNPIKHLGNTRYSFWLPLFVSLLIIVLSEFYAYSIARNPMAVGVYIIFVHVAIIIYFSLRDGMRAGVINAFIGVIYYFYIIYTRNYSGAQFVSSVETTLGLLIIYLVLALTIGWLKQTVDVLIEREANERRRLEAILEQLPVGITVTDKNGKVEHVNKKVEQLIGIKIPKGFVIGHTQPLLPTQVNGKDIQPTKGPIAQVLATGRSVASMDIVTTRKDGKNVYLQVSASPIKNKDGKLIAAASISTDVTQAKELEKRKDDFVNMASHELKTPITSMKLYFEALATRMDKNGDESMMNILTRIRFQTEKLQELVSDLLDVSRIQTGKLSFSKEKFVINDLLEETIQNIQVSTSNHKIHFSAKKQIQIYGDRFRLYQVITNLLTNAIKYSPEGGDIKVKLANSNNRATVSVQDFGIGITQDQQKKIFERLYQVTDTKEKTFPGLGMGLYISKEIVRRHKGRIWVESVKDKGATFYFALPLQK